MNEAVNLAVTGAATDHARDCSNVLVRFLTKDDEAQAQRARAILTSCTAKKPGFISTMVAMRGFLETPARLRVFRSRDLFCLRAVASS